MAISVRLDKETEAILEKTASMLRTTKSNVIKQSLRDYCQRVSEEKSQHPYQLIEDLLGGAGSGKGNLSIDGEKILRSAFRRKR